MNFKKEATFMAFLFFSPMLFGLVSVVILGKSQAEIFLMLVFSGLLIVAPKVSSKARTLIPVEWGASKMSKNERRIYYAGYTLLILLTFSIVLLSRP